MSNTGRMSGTRQHINQMSTRGSTQALKLEIKTGMRNESSELQRGDSAIGLSRCGSPRSPNDANSSHVGNTKAVPKGRTSPRTSMKANPKGYNSPRMSKRLSRARKGNKRARIAAKRVRDKINKFLVYVPAVMTLVSIATLLLFLQQIIFGGKYSDDYREEREHYDPAVDFAYYVIILIVVLFEWYAAVPLAGWVYAPFQQCGLCMPRIADELVE